MYDFLELLGNLEAPNRLFGAKKPLVFAFGVVSRYLPTR